jgi:hypothetical protein
MRTKFIVLLTLALATGSLIVSMAPFSTAVGEDPAAGMQAGEELKKQANDSAVNDGIEGDARSSDGDLVGITISGLKRGFNLLVTFTVLLPFTLENLHIPRYGAYPLGLFAQAVMGFGLVQFAANRVYS